MSLRRKLFGPSKDEVWRQVSLELHAVFEEGSWRKGARVRVEVGEWIVTLDTYTVSTGKTSATFTRMRAPYVNADGFRFRIYRSGIFSGLGQALGMQDVEVGFTEFDDSFVIKSNDPSRVRRLFANPRVRELLLSQPDVHLEVKDDEGWFGPKFPDGVDELAFRVCGVVRDVPRLKQLFELFAEVLQELCRMGSAYEGAPGVEL